MVMISSNIYGGPELDPSVMPILQMGNLRF